jgi:glyoxylase-like metal-dependent hydrolase (beta-lactamase superfamily II)
MVIDRLIVGPLQTNCYIISDQEKDSFIIDPGDESDKIMKFIRSKNLKVHFIINTHSHIDHIKADYDLKLPVYIHGLDAEALENPAKNFSSFLLGDFNSCKPAKILKDQDKIGLKNFVIEVLHTPGHTPGGICLKVDNVVFTGDTLFKDGIGRTDLPGGSYEAIIASIRNKLLCLKDDMIIYPGHGESSTIGKERGNF